MLLGFPDEDVQLEHLEVDVFLALVEHVRPKVLSDDHIPAQTLALVQLLLQRMGDVLLSIVVLHNLIDESLDSVLAKLALRLFSLPPSRPSYPATSPPHRRSTSVSGSRSFEVIF